MMEKVYREGKSNIKYFAKKKKKKQFSKTSIYVISFLNL